MLLKPLFTHLAWPVLALGAAVSLPSWADSVAVPFKASVNTQEVLGFDASRCTYGLVGATTGTGAASGMGVVTLAASDCPLTTDGVNFFFSDGRLSLTAANGDVLTASYSGTLLPVPGSNPLLHAINGSFSVTGGTGRYAGARGGGSLQGSEVLATLKGHYAVSGNLYLVQK